MQGLLVGSVPIYWGAPDITELLPHPDAIINIRAYEGQLDRLADYVMLALNDPKVYSKHTAWKNLPMDSWSAKFHEMARNSKASAFCSVCDFAASRQKENIVVG